MSRFLGGWFSASPFLSRTPARSSTPTVPTAPQNSPIAVLGDDLLAEVLIRLPGPRSAFRSKSVCKRWNSIISAPSFRRRFVSRHRRIGPAGEPEPPLLSPSELRESIANFLPQPVAGRTGLTVLDCFKDLLLLGFRSAHDEELGRTFFLCNPFTKQWIALPLPAPARSGLSFARLACQPCNSITLDLANHEGEAFTHLSEHRFRVVRICRILDLHSTTYSILDVFCSESGEWTEVDLNLSGQFEPLKDLRYFAVALNGKLYWMNGMKQVVEWNPFRPDDQMRSTLIDAPGSEIGMWSLISSSQGALHLILRPISRLDKLTVWRFEEQGDFWRKLYEVTLKELMHSSALTNGHCSESKDLKFFILDAWLSCQWYARRLNQVEPVPVIKSAGMSPV